MGAIDEIILKLIEAIIILLVDNWGCYRNFIIQLNLNIIMTILTNQV